MYVLKDICVNAVNVFDKIELIRSIANQLKATGINEEAKLELKNLCLQLNASFNLIHEKKSLAVIRKRLNKRRRHKVASQSLFYQNELANLLQEKCMCLNNSMSQTEHVRSQTTRNVKVIESIDILDFKIQKYIFNLVQRTRNLTHQAKRGKQMSARVERTC